MSKVPWLNYIEKIEVVLVSSLTTFQVRIRIHLVLKVLPQKHTYNTVVWHCCVCSRWSFRSNAFNKVTEPYILNPTRLENTTNMTPGDFCPLLYSNMTQSRYLDTLRDSVVVSICIGLNWILGVRTELGKDLNRTYCEDVLKTSFRCFRTSRRCFSDLKPL